MRVSELRERLAKRQREREDTRRLPEFQADPVGPARPGSWPVLPDRATAPAAVLDALVRDARELRAGRWRAFGHLLLSVDVPPHWQKDYFSGRDLASGRPGFRLNHRELPRGSDIKVVWEWSRWQPVVRLAQAGWVAAAEDCLRDGVACLRDWARENPPFTGWNWTSALESGMRLLALSWIDALLGAAGMEETELEEARRRLLPAHVWYTWRHRSVGSSANNHLLGELAGLIAAVARWPALERWGTSLEELAGRWEAEVLAQFAPDGGNREQALNYQLFAWELCWHARNALRAAGRPVSGEVEARLGRAADFFVTVQVPEEPWDYGDSDSATALPVFAAETDAALEWYRWFADPGTSPSIRWWLGEPPPAAPVPACGRGPGDWLVFGESGQAVCWTGAWQARWDLSPLGYLSTAAHGHLDALHLSLWLGGVALVVDPGTGAYYGDTRLRAWLASWAAHNGPFVPGQDFPRRLGPFLWGEPHGRPAWRQVDEETLEGELALPCGVVRRSIRRVQDGERDGWQVDDAFVSGRTGMGDEFEVHWQFAPGTRLEMAPGNPHFYTGERRGARFTVGFDAAWNRVQLVPETQGSVGFPVAGDLIGLCSPAFRRVEAGSVVVLRARGTNPIGYRTTFLRA